MDRPAWTVAWTERSQLAMLLVWSCLLVLPVGRLVEVPVMLMAIGGVYLLIKHWNRFLANPAFKLFGVAFLLAWVPILISLIDAVRPQTTATVAVNHLRFAFSGIFIIHALSSFQAHRRFVFLCAWLVLFWLLDGIVQAAFGRDLFGFAIPESEPGVERINALFGNEGPVYPTALTVFCPLLWEHARRHWNVWALAVILVGTISIVLMAGTRSAWISIVVLLLAYWILVWVRYRRVALRISATALVAAAVTVTALTFGSQQFAARVESSVGTLTGSTGVFSDALGHRYWIARGAINMIAAHPVNGVGAQGFRYAYAEHAAAGDPYLSAAPPIAPYHSHQLWLQILAESGVIGGVGLAALLVLLLMAGVRAPAAARQCMWPYALCLLVAYFPINSHMAIYSSFWSQIVWWLIALYCAAYGAGAAEHEGAHRGSG